MSDNTAGQILGTTLSAVVLPAAFGSAGINYLYFIIGFAGIFILLNVVALVMRYIYVNAYLFAKDQLDKGKKNKKKFGVFRFNQS